MAENCYRIRAEIDIWIYAEDEVEAIEKARSYREWDDWDFLGHSAIVIEDE